VRDLEDAVAEGRPCSNVVVIPEGRIVTGKKLELDGSVAEASGVAAVRFEGHLRVVDVDRFAVTIANGIGRSKAFGFGLLSIAPVVV
jgi:CRISPR system Cascade subunit CasE